MTSLAEIVGQYGAAYTAKYGDRLLPSHRRALRDIAQCRTPALGGHIYYCGLAGTFEQKVTVMKRTYALKS